MELTELTDYAGEKYNIQEQYKWTDFPGFSVLCDPVTGQWIALLMRQWDMDSGTQIERCDLKCGRQCLTEFAKSYLAPPLRMKGQKWIGIAFDDRTEPEIIFSLFDRAVSADKQSGYTIILDSSDHSSGRTWQDTTLPFSESTYKPRKEMLPEKIRKMKHLFVYGKESLEAKADNFYRQGMFMQDYEDDYPWKGDFFCYFPTYHDLTTNQLRGYFTWRTNARKGIFLPIPTSAAYLYIYELLNGIGASSPGDSLRRMKAFETGYLDSGIGDGRIRQNLRRWMLEFAVIHNLPPVTVQEYADVELLRKDVSLTVLQNPEDYSDEEVFSALCRFAGKRLSESPVVFNEPVKGKHLFSEAWRTAVSEFQQEGKNLFVLCFGKRSIRQWYPLSNAVYRQQKKQPDRDYLLDENRIYRCRNGLWQAEAYEKLTFDRERFYGFLHETDLRLRRYLKTGRYLHGRKEDMWACQYVDRVIENDRRIAAEAARPKITINFSGLDQIRKDALSTQNSLMTEEDLSDIAEAAATPESKSTISADDFSGLTSDSLHIKILCALLQGKPVTDILKGNHLMPSVIADEINEEMFDEFGDSIIACEDDRLTLVEDYREELAYLFEETISNPD
jgi:hypothetical protein